MSKLIYKTYRYRIYPNPRQEILVKKTFGAVRFVYNYFLDKWNEFHNRTGKNLSCHICQNMLVDLKKEYEFLKEVDSIALQSACENLENAFRLFFEKISNRPKLKKKKNMRMGYTTKLIKKNIEILKGFVKLPKLGLVQARVSRFPTGCIKRATVSRDLDGRYYVSIVVEEIMPAFAKTKQAAGIDCGIVHMCVTSDGEIFPNLHAFDKYYKELVRRQRVLSRRIERARQDGRDISQCKNIEKARLRVAAIHRRICNVRNDYLHKVTTELVRKYDILAMEDLQVSKMIKLRPLARSIADVSWRTIRTMMEYKCNWYGKEFLVVNPSYTSQMCSHCEHISRRNRASRDDFECECCGYTDHADINAAKNIIRIAQREQ